MTQCNVLQCDQLYFVLTYDDEKDEDEYNDSDEGTVEDIHLTARPPLERLPAANHFSETESHKSNSTNVKIIVHTMHSVALLEPFPPRTLDGESLQS